MGIELKVTGESWEDIANQIMVLPLGETLSGNVETDKATPPKKKQTKKKAEAPTPPEDDDDWNLGDGDDEEDGAGDDGETDAPAHEPRTQDEVKEVLKALAKDKGKDKTLKLIKKVTGVEGLSKVPEEKYGELYDAALEMATDGE